MTTTTKARYERFHQAMRDLSEAVGKAEAERDEIVRQAQWSRNRDLTLLKDVWPFGEEGPTQKAAEEALQEACVEACEQAATKANFRIREAKKRFIDQTRDSQ